MPAHFEQLSLREIDAVIAYVRTMPLVGATFVNEESSVFEAPPEE